MKKLVVLLLIQLFVFRTACYGAVSEDMSVYVRRDVFEAHIHNANKRIDDLRSSMYMFAGIFVLGMIKCASMAHSHEDGEPTLTLEDVKRLIEENNAKLSGKPSV